MNSITASAGILSGKTDQAKGRVSKKILEKLRETLDKKDIIENILDPRVIDLRDLVLQDSSGKMYDNPSARLGMGWHETSTYGNTREFVLSDKKDNMQTLRLDRDKQKIILESMHYENGVTPSGMHHAAAINKNGFVFAQVGRHDPANGEIGDVNPYR